MIKVTVILGKQGSGKTTMAKRLAKGLSTCYTNWSPGQGRVAFVDVCRDTTCLVMEGISTASEVRLLSKAKQIVKRFPYERHVSTMFMPMLILISQNLKKSDLKGIPNIQIITCKLQ